MRMTYDEWVAEGVRRFGEDKNQWVFVCPVCQHRQSVQDYNNAGAIDAVAFSCVGRWLDRPRDAFDDGPGPCNYAGGGLFQLNPVTVVDGDKEHRVFAFAEAESETAE